jgi:translocation and assembly module TamB
VLTVRGTETEGGELELEASAQYARVPLREWLARPLSLRARLSHWGLGVARRLLDRPLAGKFDGEVNLAGPLANLNGIVQLRARELKLQDREHLAVELNANVAGQRLQLEKLELQDGRDHVVVRGDLPWPVVTVEDEVRVELGEAPCRATVRAEVAELQPWLALARISAHGQLQGELELGGSLEHPELAGHVDANVVLVLPPELAQRVSAPVSVDARIEMDYRDGLAQLPVVNIEGTGGTIRGQARSPIDLTRLVRGEARLEDAPLEGAFTIRGFDLAFLQRTARGTQVSGRVEGDVTLGGSLADPAVNGTLSVHDGRVKFLAAVPQMENLDLEVVGSNEKLELSDLTAEVGAAQLRMSGKLPRPWAPKDEMDLFIRGDQVLLTRANGLRVRADLDLRVRGPLERGEVSGRVGLKNCRFVRRIPLRPGGPPRTSREMFQPFSFEDPPLRDWTFDVAVVTVEPFEVANNLLVAHVTADLHLGGTGQLPFLEGALDFSDGRIILPFTSFEVESGVLHFRADQPYDPELQISAHSRRRSIDIDVNVTGPVSEPEATLTSNPSLPSDELWILVTTGRLPKEFGVNKRFAISLLGTYFARELYGELFAGSSTEAHESLIDRFSVDSGTEISTTGAENIVLDFDMSEHWFLEAERDIYLDYNAGVGYRIKLR